MPNFGVRPQLHTWGLTPFLHRLTKVGSSTWWACFSKFKSMARSLRIEFEGAVHHVTNRGNKKADLFFSNADRHVFLSILSETIKNRGWVCHSYCLMTNHYHLLIETPIPNLSLGMQTINTLYAQHVNRSYVLSGHVFQGRYKSGLVKNDAHLLELSRYIALNPVRAGICKYPEDYEWSSYRAFLGLERCPEFLEMGFLLSQFSNVLEISASLYSEFVMDGMRRNQGLNGVRPQIKSWGLTPTKK
jgi:putative transposase